MLQLKPKLDLFDPASHPANLLPRDTGNVSTVSQTSTICLHGRVIDADTAEPVPFAKIQFANSAIGAISDVNGYFVLELDKIDTGLHPYVSVSDFGFVTKVISFQELRDTGYAEIKLVKENEAVIMPPPMTQFMAGMMVIVEEPTAEQRAVQATLDALKSRLKFRDSSIPARKIRFTKF
jgi:hypothetical protein